MAEKFLTPSLIWGSFSTDGKPTATLGEEKIVGSLSVSDVFISGRKTLNGRVSVYAKLFRKVDASVPVPCVLILKDVKTGAGEDLARRLAEEGYLCVFLDLNGKCDGAEKYTVYPEDISYANYDKSAIESVEANDVLKTCYYEWGQVTRYVLEYLYEQANISKVGGIGIGESATVMWQVAGTDKKLDCAVMTHNTGWKAYRDIRKFDGSIEPQFTDTQLQYIAGIEAQSYSANIKCPCLTLVATNSKDYDCDRAHDTVSRIDGRYYTALDYSVNTHEVLASSAYKNILIFLEEYLKKCTKTEKTLPKEPEIKCDIVDRKMVVEVTVDKDELHDIALYCAEENFLPYERSWRKITKYTENARGKIVFEYSPYQYSGLATFFVRAEYENGFIVASNILSKKFSPEEVGEVKKYNIVYSGRLKNTECSFSGICKKKMAESVIDFESDNRVVVKTGPMGIEGMFAKNGVMTYKVLAQKYAPSDGSILMLDVYAKEDTNLTVKLIAELNGEQAVYSASEKISGGKIWHNVMIEMNKFKNDKGKILKTYSNVKELEFEIEGIYLLNNILWI